MHRAGNLHSNGITNDDGTLIGIGDNNVDVALQALVSFNLDIPPGATIQTRGLPRRRLISSTDWDILSIYIDDGGSNHDRQNTKVG